ncbi:MAG TPA: glycosyltransferase N-terminal domain-containing protein [Gemmatimonadaceae bacterium]|nr:glycosyltransferase N-terminal domain-containing protein [Gemmatimonadaceae bacterium]
MNSLLRIPYSFAGNLAQALTRVAPAGQSKFARALMARRDLIRRFQEWSAAHRDPARPLLWFHAPSVGEGLQALPVIQLLRARRPDIQIAYTFYSPSAERFASSLDVDVADYLPFDTFSNAAAAVAALRPSALVFSKLDVWPALTETAADRGIPVGVVSATLPESSGRRGPIARAFLNDAYRSITRVGAIDESDAARLREQGVRADRLQVTGDTRFDQVWTRAQREPAALVERLRSARPTLVAGSSWPTDEEHLLPAWQRIREKIPDARLVIAPHEISESHLRNLARWATASSLKPALIDATDAAAADVIIVDRYGVLGDLYSLADVAYVGGGFHSAGVHSVLEPAAFGAPVVFGPRHERSREAMRLVQAEGGADIKGSADLTIRLDDWLGSSSAREVAGAHARAMVQAGLGAAERSYKLVMALLPE